MHRSLLAEIVSVRKTLYVLAVVAFEKASEGVLEDVSVRTIGIPPLFRLDSASLEEKRAND